MESINSNLERAKVEILQEKIPLGNNPEMISQNYEVILNNILKLFLFAFLIFTLLNGLVWFLISNMVKKTKKGFSAKNILSFVLKFAIVGLILFLLSYFLISNLMKIVFNAFLETDPLSFIPLFVLSLILFYFVYVSIPLINNIKLDKKGIKRFVKEVFSIGTKKFVPVITSYLIIIFSVILSSYLVFYFLELNLVLLLLSLLLLVEILIWTKIYFYIVINNLNGF